MFQTLRGDGDIKAFVGAETNTHPFAKVGVMIRESLDPSSPHVILDVRPDGSLEFMVRRTLGGETEYLLGGSDAVPYHPERYTRRDRWHLEQATFEKSLGFWPEVRCGGMAEWSMAVVLKT